jgi:Sec-independent protein secretion pathway component TatC
MTQAVMAAPIIGFYWVGIAIALLIERSRMPSS